MKQSDYCTSFYSACNQPMFNKEIVEKNIKYYDKNVSRPANNILLD